MQVFCDSGANFWFAVESVTKKLISVQTFKGSLPINTAGDNVIYSTGEWAAAIPLADGSYQGGERTDHEECCWSDAQVQPGQDP